MKKKIIIIFLLVVAIAVAIIYPYLNAENNEPPTIVVSLRTERLSNQNYKVCWIVENQSNRITTYQPGDIQRCKVDSLEFPLENEKEIKLNPKQKYYYEFYLKDLSSGNHTIEMTAKCEEGTKGTFKTQIEVQ